MNYYFNKVLTGTDFPTAIETVTAALATEGFGVLTDIDVQATFRKKLDIEFRNYRILGACNPGFAYKALQSEDKIGTFLPCNVIVQQLEDGSIEVAAVDPIASMISVENDALGSIAGEVRDKLERVINSL